MNSIKFVNILNLDRFYIEQICPQQTEMDNWIIFRILTIETTNTELDLDLIKILLKCTE